MILADTLSISINLLLVAHVVVSLLLILVVLMQRPKQEGLGAAFGGGVTDQMFGAQTTNVLQKGTVYLGSAFMILSLVLAILIGNQNFTKALSEPAPVTVEEAPAVPGPESGSIKDELGEDDGAAPTGTEPAPTTGGEDTPAGTEPAPTTGGEDTPAGTTPSEGSESEAPSSDASTPSEGGATPAGDPSADETE